MKFFTVTSIFFVFAVVACKSQKQNVTDNVSTQSTASLGQKDNFFINKRGDTIRKINLSLEEWKSKLSPMEFNVLREKGTERPFTGDLLKVKDEGLYTCRGCGIPLFRSKHKFDSGTGWPSFFDVDDHQAIHKDTDYDLGYPRTELTCSKCGGHLGHVFEDGPEPTGLRYCINAVSLDFVKAEN